MKRGTCVIPPVSDGWPSRPVDPIDGKRKRVDPSAQGERNYHRYSYSECSGEKSEEAFDKHKLPSFRKESLARFLARRSMRVCTEDDEARSKSYRDACHLANIERETFKAQVAEHLNTSVCVQPIDLQDSPHRLHHILALENTSFGERILIGVVVPRSFSEGIEFYFFNAKHMALCVGVGLPRAKAILSSNLSITIKETGVSEEMLRDTWMTLLQKKSGHLSMKVKGKGSRLQGDGHNEVATSNLDKKEALSRYGVWFGDHTQFVDETCDASEVSWPLLYDMAWFLLRNVSVQCPDESGKSSAGESGSSQGNNEGKDDSNDMVKHLQQKHDSLSKYGNLGRGGSGDEDGMDRSNSISDDDTPPLVLKVTVYPNAKSDILNLQGKPYGLDGVSLSPTLVFEFRRNHESKRIRLKTHTRFELTSSMNVITNKNMFGWYHNNIEIYSACVAPLSENSRAVSLEPQTCRILNPMQLRNYTLTDSTTSAQEDEHTFSGEAGFHWGISGQGNFSRSTTQQKGVANSKNIEIPHECICGGFHFQDVSGSEPCHAGFRLFYPLENFDARTDKGKLLSEGLMRTIEPSIESTWIPLDESNASPYLFRAERALKFHIWLEGQQEETVIQFKQEYVLQFFVNHAMTHLNQQRRNIELSGNQQQVANVLMVGSVY